MNTIFKFRWKRSLMNVDWYCDNPANDYLSNESKATLIRLWILGKADLDSEAEVYFD